VVPRSGQSERLVRLTSFFQSTPAVRAFGVYKTPRILLQFSLFVSDLKSISKFVFFSNTQDQSTGVPMVFLRIARKSILFEQKRRLKLSRTQNQIRFAMKNKRVFFTEAVMS